MGFNSRVRRLLFFTMCLLFPFNVDLLHFILSNDKIKTTNQPSYGPFIKEPCGVDMKSSSDKIFGDFQLRAVFYKKNIKQKKKIKKFFYKQNF